MGDYCPDETGFVLKYVAPRNRDAAMREMLRLVEHYIECGRHRAIMELPGLQRPVRRKQPNTGFKTSVRIA